MIWNKKYSSKQVVSMIYTLGKDFLKLLLLKVCETSQTEREKMFVINFGLYEFSFHS